jgi:hypothetical protein
MKARYLLSVAIPAMLLFVPALASAGIAGMAQSAISPSENTEVIKVARVVRYNRAVAVRGVNRAVVVNRGVRVNRAVVVNRGLYRGRYVYRGGPWVRPRAYWWPIGGAVAAGAALGMIAASTATWAGTPPGPGYCWYYTDPTQRQGFWDQCP